jgi:phenylpropionate dioxygenase-like ring-hydroxylating dioxygenase large terminal subunit
MDSNDPRRDFWHPVALSESLGAKPSPAVLLDEQLVLWRSGGKVLAFSDLCLHRGTRLSIGWIEDEQLVCAYHGWRYAESGAVVKIPSLPPERPIPKNARARRFLCQERYGLIFVCLGEPRAEIFDVPEFNQDDYKVHIVGPVRWRAGAARSFENFFDEAHLPWAHPGLLGNRDDAPVIPAREIRETEHGFYFEYQSECASRVDPSKISTNLLTYDIRLPYTLYHEHVNPEGERVIDLFFCSPISDKISERYMVVARNFAKDRPADPFIEFTTKVWEQDRVIIETQRPEEVSFDWAEELHLKGPDTPAIAYRSRMRTMKISINESKQS